MADDVPLEPLITDIPEETIKKPVPVNDFIKNIIEFGVRKTGSAFANVSTSTTVYTAPKDKNVYIISISLTGANNAGAVADACNMKISGELVFELYVESAGAKSMVSSFPTPVKMFPGETISISAGSDAKCIGSFIGYEVDTSLDLF